MLRILKIFLIFLRGELQKYNDAYFFKSKNNAKNYKTLLLR